MLYPLINFSKLNFLFGCPTIREMQSIRIANVRKKNSELIFVGRKFIQESK